MIKRFDERQVITRFTADPKEHVAAVEKIQKAEKKRGEESLSWFGKIDKAIGDQVRAFDSLGDGMKNAYGAAMKVVQFAIDAFNESLEHSRLLIAAQGTDLSALKRASAGLKTETDLLRDAARMQAGEFKLTNREMAVAEKAMLALERRGFESQKVNEAVTKSLVSLQTDGLKELGIRVSSAGLDMDNARDRAELYRRTMEALTEASKDVAEGQRSQGEAVRAAAVSLQDSWSQVKRSIVDLALAFEPLITSVAKLGGKIAGVVEYASKLNGLSKLVGGGRMSKVAMGGLLDLIPEGGDFSAADYSQAVMADLAKQRAARQAEIDRDTMESLLGVGGGVLGGLRGFGAVGGVAGGTAPGGGQQLPFVLGQVAVALNRLANATGDSDTADRFGLSLGSSQLIPEGFAGGDLALQMDLPGKDLTQQWNEKLGMNRAANAERESRLAQIFGKPEEFQLYQTMFQGLTGAIQGAMSAWIDGSMGAAAAFKKGIAEMVKGVALQATVFAAMEVAHGIAAAVGGNFPKAAGHALAAAKYAAVGVAAAVAARALGGGGAAAGAPGGAGAGAAAPVGGSGSQQQQGTHQVIVIGSEYGGGDTHREKRHKFERDVRRVVSATGGQY